MENNNDNDKDNNNHCKNNNINSYKSDDYYLEYYMSQQDKKNISEQLFIQKDKHNENKKKNNYEKIAYSSSSSDYDLNEEHLFDPHENDNEINNIFENRDLNDNYRITKNNFGLQNYNYQKKIFCTNCGKYGHNYKKCIYPMISVGIICVLFTPVYFNDIIYYTKKFQSLNNDFSLNQDEIIKLNRIYDNIKSIDEINYDKIIKYLMVQRKYSFSYVEIIRGKYDLDNVDYINNMIQYMTMDERKRLIQLPFEQLWNELWYKNDNSINRDKEMNISNEKFNLLRNGLTIKKNEINIEYSLQKLIKNAKYKYNFPEWGFPKGRRNLKEKNIDCANREFREETSLKYDEYQVVNLSPIEELFMGMNNVRYKNIYYMSQICKKVDLKVDENNELQKIEISNIQWYTLNQALDIIREYDIEKRNIIINNHNSLKTLFFIFQNLLKNFLKK